MSNASKPPAPADPHDHHGTAAVPFVPDSFGPILIETAARLAKNEDASLLPREAFDGRPVPLTWVRAADDLAEAISNEEIEDWALGTAYDGPFAVSLLGAEWVAEAACPVAWPRAIWDEAVRGYFRGYVDTRFRAGAGVGEVVAKRWEARASRSAKLAYLTLSHGLHDAGTPVPDIPRPIGQTAPKNVDRRPFAIGFYGGADSAVSSGRHSDLLEDHEDE